MPRVHADLFSVELPVDMLVTGAEGPEAPAVENGADIMVVHRITVALSSQLPRPSSLVSNLYIGPQPYEISLGYLTTFHKNHRHIHVVSIAKFRSPLRVYIGLYHISKRTPNDFPNSACSSITRPTCPASPVHQRLLHPHSPPHYATIAAPSTVPPHPLPPQSYLSLLPTPATINPLHRHRNLYPLRRPFPRPDPWLHYQLSRTRRTRRRCPRHHH